MIFSENLYFLILFTLPAAFNVIYNTYIRAVPTSYRDKTVELAECIVYCLVVFFVNALILRKSVTLFAEYTMLEKENVQAFVDRTKFNYIDFMIRYFVVNLGTSIGVIIIWNSIVKKVYLYICNKVNKLRRRPEVTAFSDVWRNLFEANELLDVYNHAVEIRKDGVLITAGLIAMHQAPNELEKEFVLYNTELIKEILEEDKERVYDERILKEPIYEYYNLANDVLIKFYSLEKYDETYKSRE